MLPRDIRLLRGIRDALEEASRGDISPELKGTFDAVGIALNELMLRQNRDFFSVYYRDGLQLARDGLVLLPDRSDTGGGDAVAALPAVLDTDQHMGVLGAQLTVLSEVLEQIVCAVASGPDRVELRRWLSQVVAWETRLHAYRLTRAEENAESEDSQACRFSGERIGQYLLGKFPEWGELSISQVKTLAGGFSKTTVMFDLEGSGAGRQSLVIRAEQPLNLLFLEGARVANEYFVLKFAHENGIPVPEPLWLEQDAGALGASFLVSKKAPGRNFGTAVSVDETLSEELLIDLVENLVRIHALPVPPEHEYVLNSHLAHWRQYATLTECTAAMIEFWRVNSELLGLPPSPSRARMFAWLAANVPDCEDAPSLVHRDYGLHNVLIENDRVASILDWEGASLGDPAEDFVWFADVLGGQVDRDRLHEMYVQAGGKPIPEYRLKYYDVFRSLKYAVVCPRALSLFEQVDDASVATCRLGLLFPYHGSRELNEHIDRAESLLVNHTTEDSL